MKYAFLLKNFKSLSAEEQAIFSAHILTLIFCFFPWRSVEPFDFLVPTYWHTAFSASSALMGVVVLFVSLSLVLFFVDKLLETRKIHLPFSANYLFMGAGTIQIFLILLMASVLLLEGKHIGNVELRFGIFAALIAQIAGLVSGYLEIQSQKKKKARSFFQNPSEKMTPSAEVEEPPKPTPAQTNLIDETKTKTEQSKFDNQIES